MSSTQLGLDGIPYDNVRLTGSNGAVGQDSSKNLLVGLRSSSGVEPNIGLIGFGDNILSSYNELAVASFALTYNGNSWDRLRSILGALGIQATPYSGLQSVAITTIATTAVKASAGAIGTLTNAGNAITGVITIYDSLSATGKKIWSGTLAAGQVLNLGIPCGTGITITTVAADTLAVSYA